jgi:hypothetical protein
MSNVSRLICALLAVMIANTLLDSAAQSQMYQAAPRGPLARLIRTPDETGTLPPYALADQTGAIQRYVEPVPGIDLEAYVNQVVSVRHDTGQTLLASQLDLTSQSLMPLIGESGPEAAVQTPYDRSVRQAQHVDRDDSTVELIEEGVPMPNGAVPVQGSMPMGVMPQGAVYPDGAFPMYSGEMQPGMPMPGMTMPGMTMPGMYGDPMYCDPMTCGPQMAPYPGQYIGPESAGFVQPYCPPQQQKHERSHIYADVDLMFLRAHLMEEGFGKLSEKYEFTPRFIFGFTDVGGLNGRIRYWTYGRENDVLSDGNVRLEFDVWDIEGTHHFTGRRSVVALAAGVRFAQINLSDQDDDEAGTDLLGLTMAADGFTPCITSSHGTVGFVYGGRLSLLGGDWGGDDDHDFIDERHRDDNVVVHELYAGIECSRCYRNCNVHARLAWEMQNWHSDVISDSTNIDTVALLGPGLQIGAEF